MIAGSVAPGELISIFGQNLGPNTLQGLQLANASVTTSLAGVQVLFNGVAAPIILAYSTQLNVVAPFEVQGSSSVTVEVEYNDLTSALVTIAVTPAAAGIFTANGSGTGQAAALNQDYSVNNSAHPAATGSAVTLYLTGAGQTIPGGIDGFVDPNPSTLSRPALPVTAEIGGVPATVLYAGSGVDIVSGVIQMNVLVPSGLAPGQQPVTVTIGSGAAQTGVTIAIQ
jgi:uncharacterized protein (TIGR03437 family)